VVAELRGKRVLVIEDSPVVAEFVAEALESLGCEVVGPARNMAVARELADMLIGLSRRSGQGGHSCLSLTR
jgi:CheY-like chemotaxis protein